MCVTVHEQCCECRADIYDWTMSYAIISDLRQQAKDNTC